jgi:uncharacterized FlaG/YvyC family protein
MNAYELANELENIDRLWNVDENLMLKNCAMLRQQADRIAELEKELQRINANAEFELDRAYNTPQIKELSDKEITEVLNDENIAEYHQGNWLVLPYAFARAILKKASEK